MKSHRSVRKEDIGKSVYLRYKNDEYIEYMKLGTLICFSKIKLLIGDEIDKYTIQNGTGEITVSTSLNQILFVEI
jgi:hypothetical protein